MVARTMQAWRGTGRHAIRQLPRSKPMSTREMAVAILPWAKEKHPDKYADTIKQANDDAKLRRYLVRLVEIRWESEPEWRSAAPLAVLDETALIKRVRTQAGVVLTVGGKLAKGSCHLRWIDLRVEPEDFRLLAAAIIALDMEVVR